MERAENVRMGHNSLRKVPLSLLAALLLLLALLIGLVVRQLGMLPATGATIRSGLFSSLDGGLLPHFVRNPMANLLLHSQQLQLLFLDNGLQQKVRCNVGRECSQFIEATLDFKRDSFLAFLDEKLNRKWRRPWLNLWFLFHHFGG